MVVSFWESKKHHELFSYLPEEQVLEGGSQMAEEWKEIVGGNVFAFQQVGDTIEGVLVARRSGKFDNVIYDIETKQGLKTVFGTAILDSRMETVVINKPVKIEFTGEVKTGTGRLARNFRVFTR